MLAFCKKRDKDIPAVLACIHFFVLESYNIGALTIDISFSSMLIRLSGLQALLVPRFINPVSTIRFVGMILIFYLIYPLIVYLPRDGPHLILASCAVLLPFVVMRLAFDIIDFRFFMYYGIFVAGILASKYGVMYKFSPQPRFLRWLCFADSASFLDRIRSHPPTSCKCGGEWMHVQRIRTFLL
jgi:hypothetical protein